MKAIVFTRATLKAFDDLPKRAQIAIVAKLERYVAEGAGDIKALAGQPGLRIRVGDYRAVFFETEALIEVVAVGHRRDIYEWADRTMKPQFIHTEAGEELVVISRREYDALLAAKGDEDAEDRAMARLTQDYLAEKAAGRGADVPFWFVKLVMQYGSPVAAARRHHGCTQIELARMLDISQGHLSDIERGRRQLTDTQRHRIAGHTGVEAGWLV